MLSTDQSTHRVAVFGLLITLGQAVVYVFSGMYGDPSDIGYGISFLIVVQVRLIPEDLFLYFCLFGSPSFIAPASHVVHTRVDSRLGSCLLPA
jgi:hypothetical protein